MFFNTYDGSIEYDYKVKNKLEDLQKIFDYLDNGLTDDVNVRETLDFARKCNDTKRIKFKYYVANFYKKGTCHLEFTNLDILEKFNIFSGRNKAFLPPSYGKKKYGDMTQEEKIVIDNFSGETEYNRIMSNTEYFIVETSKLLMLT